MMAVNKMLDQTLESPLSGLILAGGEGRRMAGRDKGLISLSQKPLVEYAIECITPLVDDLTISCNRNRELYQGYQLDCISDNTLDNVDGYQGPMAGLAAGLQHAKHDWLLVMPCDTPLMSSQVMAQLVESLNAKKPHNSLQAIIFSHQGLQPLHGLYHRSMLPIFEQCLAENKNALQRLLRSLDSIEIHQALECELNFNNANDPEELAIIETLLAAQ